MKTLFHAFSILILTTWPALRADAQERRHNLMPTPAESRVVGIVVEGADAAAVVDGIVDANQQPL